MQFEITPQDGMVDGDLVIRVIEASPRSRVTINVETQDGHGRTWRSSAQFLASGDGTIDLSKEPPIQGAYNALDPLGLVMTMTPVGKDPASIFATADGSDIQLEFTIGDRDAENPTTASAVRRFKAASVARMAVSEGPIQGTLFYPAGTEQRPAVMVVPGTIHRDAAAIPLAALLASHGYVTFVVDYFGGPGLPDTLAGVPLEQFGAVVEWLRNRPQVEPAKVGAIGIERGAEGLMAAASHITELRLGALIAIAPSCVTWQGVSPAKGTVPAWTLGGEALPYIAIKGGSGQKLMRSLTKKEGGAISQLAAHMDALKDAEGFARAALPVEKIAGPILLLGGFDDQQWPSGEMAELIYQARRSAKCTDGDQKITFPKVGRLIRFPFLPPTAFRYLDPDGGGLMLGGTADATMHADRVAWAKSLDFLSTHLGQPSPAPTIGQGDANGIEPPATPAPPLPDIDLAPAPDPPPPPTMAPPPGGEVAAPEASPAAMPDVIPPPPRPPSALPPVIPPPPRPVTAATPEPPPPRPEPAPTPPPTTEQAPPPPPPPPSPASDFSPPPDDFSPPPPADDPPSNDSDLPPSFS